MSKTFQIFRFVVLCLAGSIMVVGLWRYVIPGILLWVIFREGIRRWMISATAILIVLIVLIFRCASGNPWLARIGDQSSGNWWSELMSGLLSWAVVVILLHVGYQIPGLLLKGFRSLPRSIHPQSQR